MVRVKLCPNCGHENKRYANECESCAFSLVMCTDIRESANIEESSAKPATTDTTVAKPGKITQPRRVKICPACQHENDELATYCLACRFKLASEKDSPPSSRTGVGRNPVEDVSYHTVRPPDTGIAAQLICSSDSGYIRNVLPGQKAGRQAEIDLNGLAGSKYISRNHAQFLVDREGGWTLVNLTATTDTFLNSRKMYPDEKCFVHDGDRIILGNTEFYFKVIGGTE